MTAHRHSSQLTGDAEPDFDGATRVAPFPVLRVGRLADSVLLRRQACEAIKAAIAGMDIYGHPEEIRLDERQLSAQLGVSRTPIREALTVLEQEGFVRSVPRRGMYVVRKSKAEVVEMITVWAAIESLAARLATVRASDAEFRHLRALFTRFGSDPSSRLHEYSQANMAFHKAIIGLGGCALMTEVTDNLFIHMRAVREVTIQQSDRARRSMSDHLNIIAALEARDADLVERLVRMHTLGLAEHIEQHGDALNEQSPKRKPVSGRTKSDFSTLGGR